MTDREMDALVAEKFFGWCYWTRFGFWWFGPKDEWEDLGEPVVQVTREDAEANYCPETKVNRDVPQWPRYTTDPSAWDALLDKLGETWFYVRVDTSSRDGHWAMCRVWNPEASSNGFMAEAKTKGLAIVKAALASVGERV